MENNPRFHVNNSFLSNRRKVKKYTQEEIGLLLECSREKISQLEKPAEKQRKDQTLPFNKIMELAQILECSLREIIRKDDIAELEKMPDVPNLDAEWAVTFDKYDRSFNVLLKRLKTFHEDKKIDLPTIIAFDILLEMSPLKREKVIDYIHTIRDYNTDTSSLTEKYTHMIRILCKQIDELKEQLADTTTSDNQ